MLLLLLVALIFCYLHPKGNAFIVLGLSVCMSTDSQVPSLHNHVKSWIQLYGVNVSAKLKNTVFIMIFNRSLQTHQSNIKYLRVNMYVKLRDIQNNMLGVTLVSMSTLMRLGEIWYSLNTCVFVIHNIQGIRRFIYHYMNLFQCFTSDCFCLLFHKDSVWLCY